MGEGGGGKAALPGSRLDIIDFNFSGSHRLPNTTSLLREWEEISSERSTRRFDLNIETNFG
jgi:hypothetical protein